MAKTCEELYIFRIENAIRAIKLGNKTPDQVDVTEQFKRLKSLNPMMWEDLQERYNTQLNNFNKSKNKER